MRTNLPIASEFYLTRISKICLKQFIFITYRCLDFVAMSLCGGMENGSGPTVEQFDRHVIPYHEVNKYVFLQSSLRACECCVCFLFNINHTHLHEHGELYIFPLFMLSNFIPYKNCLVSLSYSFILLCPFHVVVLRCVRIPPSSHHHCSWYD